MPKTLLEKRLSQKKKRAGKLVPLLEDLFRHPMRFDNADAEFIRWLVVRNNARELRRREQNAFSPSSLGSCLRQVYLQRNHKKHAIEKVFVPRVEVSSYFFDGEFEHMKWQAAIRKLAALDDFRERIELVGGSDRYPGFEIPVKSKRGDHAGTIDILLRLDGEPFVVDVKSMNLNAFNQATAGRVDHKYPVQTADYLMLLNSQRPKILPERVEKAILLFKSKAGPQPDYPLALFEMEVNLKDHLPEVQLRLELLRDCEKEGSIPEPECKTTTNVQFQGCSFCGYCREEVKRIEKRTKTANEERLSIARPTGNRRTRRPRPGG